MILAATLVVAKQCVIVRGDTRRRAFEDEAKQTAALANSRRRGLIVLMRVEG